MGTSTPAAVPDVATALGELKRHATKATLQGMARYAIPSERAFGVAMRDIQALAKRFGKLSAHDKGAADDRFAQALPLIESAASDERHFVKKAVNMALRATGKRSAALHGAASAVAARLAASPDAAARWIGKDALRELQKTPPRRTLKTST